MARSRRIDLPGVVQHVVQRGNNRGACFFSDADRRLFLRFLGEASVRHACAIHAYVLMTNHVHLLVTAERPGALSDMIQDIGRRYVRIVNDVRGRSGTLWEGRYRSHLVDSETYLLACYRYIELNPVRAGMVSDASDYQWSSYRHNAFGIADQVVTAHAVLASLGATAEERHCAYRALFAESFDDPVVDAIRTAVTKGWVLGSDGFKDRVSNALGRSVRPPKRGRPIRSDAEQSNARADQRKC